MDCVHSKKRPRLCPKIGDRSLPLVKYMSNVDGNAWEWFSRVFPNQSILIFYMPIGGWTVRTNYDYMVDTVITPWKWPPQIVGGIINRNLCGCAHFEVVYVYLQYASIEICYYIIYDILYMTFILILY